MPQSDISLTVPFLQLCYHFHTQWSFLKWNVLPVFHSNIVIVYLRILRQHEVERALIRVQGGLGSVPAQLDDLDTSSCLSTGGSRVKVGTTFTDMREASKVQLDCSYQPKLAPQAAR